MFRRRSDGATDGTAQDSPGAQSPDGPADVRQPRSAAEAAKGRPTPKRSVAERGRRQPITGSRPATPRTPEEKARARADRTRKAEAMQRGEDWALNPRDRGAAKALTRDFIDSKRRATEYFIYVVLVLFAAVFIRIPAIEALVSPLIIVLCFVLLIQGQLIKSQLRKLLEDRLPGTPIKGLTFYATMRALQIRRLRVPAPRVKPGDTI